MSEKDIVLSRLREKKQLRKAWSDITKLFIGASSIIFITLLAVWAIQRLPELEIPLVYRWNTLVIIISSAFIVYAERKILRDEPGKAYKYVGWGLVAGLVFIMLQLIGWQQLMNANATHRNILLPFSTIHFLHVVVGLLLLQYVLKKLRQYQVHSKEMAYSKNVFRFWHFLGVVWLLIMVIA